MIYKSSRAFSMIEVVVASVILMTTIVLVFGTIAKTREPALQASRRLKATAYIQDVLDALRGRVSASEWRSSDSLLSVGTHHLNEVLSAPQGVSGTYTVSDMGAYRKVTASVFYDNSL